MKKFICVILIIIIPFSISGCKGPKQDVEKIGLIFATGIDLTPDNKYKLTVQVLNIEKELSQNNSRKSEGDPSEVTVYTSVGDTPYDVFNNLSINYGRDVFLGHNQYMIIGKELAESGLDLLTDALIRGQQGRPDTTLLLARGNASDILKFMPADEKIPAKSVKNLIKMQSRRGYSPNVSRLDFVNALSSKTASPVMGVIELDKDYNEGTSFKLAETAVFKKDKLIGFLDINETRGMQWIKGRVKDGTITAYSKDNSKKTFFIINASSKIKPIIENDKVTLKIIIKIESSILVMTGKSDPMKEPKVMDELGKLQSEAVEKEVRLALYAAQNKYDADIFDFGGMIHKKYPKEWSKLESKWDKIFPYINTEVNVTSNIKNPGIISQPIINQ